MKRNFLVVFFIIFLSASCNHDYRKENQNIDASTCYYNNSNDKYFYTDLINLGNNLYAIAYTITPHTDFYVDIINDNRSCLFNIRAADFDNDPQVVDRVIAYNIESIHHFRFNTCINCIVIKYNMSRATPGLQEIYYTAEVYDIGGRRVRNMANVIGAIGTFPSTHALNDRLRRIESR